MSKRRRHAGHDSPHADERWLITYADMVTLLLAVFIVMYALSDTNVRKFTEFAQSLSAAFNTDVFQGTTAYTITTGQETAPNVGTFDSGKGVIGADLRTVSAVVGDFAISQGLDGQIEVEEVPEGIAIRISDTLLFEPGRARLAGDSPLVIQRIAATLAPLPNRIRIEGHTDDQAPSGIFYADNWELSTARALAVLHALEAGGIKPNRLVAAGYGEFDPIVAGSDAVAQARNRRVDLLILYPPTGEPASEGAFPAPIGTFAPPIGNIP
jgi:chemotaxis protein MotB